MNTRDLKYLIAFADLKNFTHAAEYCAVSQPTLSAQLKKLEHYLGIPLFERIKNQIYLTETGKVIVTIARKMIAEENVLRETANRLRQNPFVGSLALGAFPTLASYVFPEYVSNIKKHYPKLQIQLQEEKTHILIERLLEGTLDAALLALPTSHPSLESHVLFQDSFFLAVNHQHPFAELDSISRADLEGRSLLLLEEGHCMRDHALQFCAESNLHEDNFRATSLETLRLMVKHNMGITLIPSIAIQPEDQAIRYIRIDDAPVRTIGIVNRVSHSKPLVITEIVSILSRITMVH